MSKIIDSISDIIPLYNVFILDQWGVMHDGYKGYDHAINSVEKLIRENKKLIIISNSSKRKTSSIRRLKSLGFDKNHFIEVMTSGEMIWQEISTSIDNYGNNLKNCFHIYDSSKEDGLEFRNGLENFNFVSKVNDANFILACTPFENTEPIDYIPILKVALDMNLTMFCANPDFLKSCSMMSFICFGGKSRIFSDNCGRQCCSISANAIEPCIWLMLISATEETMILLSPDMGYAPFLILEGIDLLMSLPVPSTTNLIFNFRLGVTAS